VQKERGDAPVAAAKAPAAKKDAKKGKK